MMDLKKQVGERIREVRKLKGFTQKELGERLGVTHATINGYEKGIQNLTLDTIEKVAEALNVEPKTLLN